MYNDNAFLFAAFKRGLEMRAIIEDENAEDGVQLRVSILFENKSYFLKNFYTHIFILLCLQSYCQNHSLNKKAGNVEDFDDEKGQKKSMTAEERSLARRQK